MSTTPHHDQLIALLGEHASLGNGKARELLGWDEVTYEEGHLACGLSGPIGLMKCNT